MDSLPLAPPYLEVKKKKIAKEESLTWWTDIDLKVESMQPGFQIALFNCSSFILSVYRLKLQQFFSEKLFTHAVTPTLNKHDKDDKW